MWKIRTFKTRKAMLKWLASHEHSIQWREVFVNNAYGLEYRPIRFI